MNSQSSYSVFTLNADKCKNVKRQKLLYLNSNSESSINKNNETAAVSFPIIHNIKFTTPDIANLNSRNHYEEKRESKSNNFFSSESKQPKINFKTQKKDFSFNINNSIKLQKLYGKLQKAKNHESRYLSSSSSVLITNIKSSDNKPKTTTKSNINTLDKEIYSALKDKEIKKSNVDYLAKSRYKLDFKPEVKERRNPIKDIDLLTNIITDKLKFMSRINNIIYPKIMTDLVKSHVDHLKAIKLKRLNHDISNTKKLNGNILVDL